MTESNSRLTNVSALLLTAATLTWSAQLAHAQLPPPPTQASQRSAWIPE
jgi:hypothetical protein